VKKIWLRGLSVFIVPILVLSVCTSCSSTPAASTSSNQSGTTAVYAENGLSKNQKVTITIGFADQGNGRIWYDNGVKAFEQKFPNVTVKTQYSATMDQIVKTKLAANDDSGMFNYFFVGTNGWTGVVKAGKAATLEDLLQRSPYDAPGKKLTDVLLPGLEKAMTRYSDGHLYSIPSLPSSIYVGGLYFNKTLFDQKGWNENPKTWTEFVALCATIKAAGVSPIAYAGMYDYEKFAFGSKEFELAAANGETSYLENHQNYVLPYYTTPENLTVWQKIQQLGNAGYIDASSTSINHTISQMMMIQGKAAMVPSGDWVANEMKSSTPADFKWGYMAVPITEDSNNTVYLYGGANQAYVVYSKKPELEVKWSKELILWFFNLNQQVDAEKYGGALPMRSDFNDDATRVSNMSQIHTAVMTYIKNHKTQMVNGENWNIALTDVAWSKALKLITDNNAFMAIGKKDPKAVLTEADSYVKTAVTAYNSTK
jgi:N-acetylglucosamine transport system substrate-binding protein